MAPLRSAGEPILKKATSNQWQVNKPLALLPKLDLNLLKRKKLHVVSFHAFINSPLAEKKRVNGSVV